MNAPNSQREALIQALRDLADNAYCDYIRQMQRTECLGWEQKVKEGKFGRAELEAHNRGAAFFGKHQAYIEARQRLEALPPESGGPSERDAVLEEVAAYFDTFHSGVEMFARTISEEIRALKNAAPQARESLASDQGQPVQPARASSDATDSTGGSNG